MRNAHSLRLLSRHAQPADVYEFGARYFADMAAARTKRGNGGGIGSGGSNSGGNVPGGGAGGGGGGAGPDA